MKSLRGFQEAVAINNPFDAPYPFYLLFSRNYQSISSPLKTIELFLQYITSCPKFSQMLINLSKRQICFNMPPSLVAVTDSEQSKTFRYIEQERKSQRVPA